MTAIEVGMTPTVNNDHRSIAGWLSCINSDYQLIFDFFDECVNQKLIMNKVSIEVDGVTDLTRYYATDYNKADCFKQKFKSHQLNFSVGQLSIKQFWNKFEFDIDFKLKEIDFINNIDLLDLVNYDTGEIWNTKFPLTNPYGQEENLQ
jgi:hypothetical protein